MRRFFVVVLFAAGVAVSGAANAEDGCGPGCHSAVNGGCMVDGWASGARVFNECPVGTRPQRPCPRHAHWRYGACFAD